MFQMGKKAYLLKGNTSILKFVSEISFFHKNHYKKRKTVKKDILQSLMNHFQVLVVLLN